MSTLTVPAARSRRSSVPRVAEAPPRTPVHLTRRGRLAMTLVLVGAISGVLGLTQPEALAFGGSDGPATTRVTVRPGETLWTIASRVAPDADPRSTIARIDSLNGLHSSTVPAGSVLLVPATG